MISIQRHRWDNGLTLLVNTHTSLPVCTVMIWLRVGSRDERQGLTGMSHYLEHCYSMGTRRFQPRENSWIIQRMGGTKNAFTSRDYTAYVAHAPSEYLETLLDLEADRFQHLTLPEPNVRSEKEVIKEEKRLRYEDSPFGKMYEVLYEKAYDGHPYQHPVIGRWEDLERMTRADMLDFYRHFYRPERAVVVVSGSVSFEETLRWVDRYFGSLPRGDNGIDERSSGVVPVNAGRHVLRKESELEAVLMGYRAVAVDHPDFIPLAVLSSLLSSGRSSRLYQALVYRLQIATFASTSFEGALEAALFQIMAQAKPGRTVEELEQAIEKELDRLKTEGVNEDEMTRVRNQVEAAMLFGMETNEHRAELIGRYEVISRAYGADFVNRSLEWIRSVSAGDVCRVARSYLVPERRTSVVLQPLGRSSP